MAKMKTKKTKYKLKRPSGASLFAGAFKKTFKPLVLVNTKPNATEQQDKTAQALPDDGNDADVESQPGTSGTAGFQPPKRPSYCRTYNCPDCTFTVKKSKIFIYHQVHVHQRKWNVYTCNFCEYSCRQRNKVQRHLKLVHRFDVEMNEVRCEFQCEKPGEDGLQPIPEEYLDKVEVDIDAGGDADEDDLEAELKALQEESKLYVDTESPTMVPIQSRIRTLSPLKMKIALSTPASRQAARGKDLPALGIEEHLAELTSGGKRLFKCKYCLFNNPDKHRVTKHVQTIHLNGRVYKCSICNFKATKKRDYYIHKAKHSKKEILQCEECNYTTDFKPNLDRHRQNHLSVFAYTCKFCTYSCDHEGTVKRHMATNHTNNAENVSIIFPDVDTSAERTIETEPPSKSTILDGGEEIDNNNESIGAEEIQEIDTMDLSLRNSEGIPTLQTVEGSFFCPLCGLRYKRCGDLNRHMKLKHKTTIKDYVKDYTSPDRNQKEAKAANDDNEDEEEDLVDEEKEESDNFYYYGFSKDKLKCTYCSYMAKWPSDLRRHMMVHTIEKRFKCPQCNKQYKYVGDLNVHLRRDHETQPDSVQVVKVPTVPVRKSSPAMFKCPTCPYTSPWKSEVDRHSKLHKDDKPFRCNYCDYQTHWKGDIRRHMYKHHPAVMADGIILEDVITIDQDKTHSNKETVHLNDNKGDLVMEIEDDNPPEPEMSREFGPLEEDEKMEDELNDFDSDIEEDQLNSQDSSAMESPTTTCIFRCHFCSFTTNAPSKLNAHEATHTNLKQYMCPVCGRRANWKWDIRKHIKKDHAESTMDVVKLSRQEAEATIQNYLDTMPVVRREHHLNVSNDQQQDDSGEKSFRCGACAYSSSARVSVSRHIRTSHSGQNVDILFTNEDDVDDEVHLNFPHASTPIGYNTPEKAAPRNVPSPAPSSASSIGPVDKPYMCAECGKTGNIKADIRKHYHYKHPSEPIRIFYCDSTGTKLLPVEESKNPVTKRSLSTSSSSSSLTDNNKTPSKEPTPDKTTPVFTVPTSSGKPQSIVSILKPYMCAECGKRSGTKADIKKHYNYMHPGQEVKIIYQESVTSPFAKESVSPASTPKTSPYKATDGSGALLSANPKSFGYTKPFKCAECGRRSNWKWDLNKHMRLKHPNSNSRMIILSEDEARETYQAYMKEFSLTTYQTASKRELGINTKNEEGKPVKQAVTYPSKGIYKEFKCSGCPYRSNWRSDIQRHTKRKHQGRARLVIMDKEEAKNSLNSYNYDPRKERKMMQKLAGSNGKANGSNKHQKSDMNFIWKCGRCTFKNKDRKMVVSHLSTHNVKAFRCTVCNYGTNYRSSAFRHVKVRHKTDNLSLCRVSIQCIKLGKGGSLPEKEGDATTEESQNGQNESVNMETENGNGVDFELKDAELEEFYDMYKCKICGFHSSWRSCVTRHLREKHKGERKEKFGNVIRVRKFLKAAKQSPDSSGKKKRNYKCDTCPFRTHSVKALHFHTVCHKPQPGENQNKCPYCPYYVKASRLLRQHIKIHEENVYTEESQDDLDPPTPTTPLAEENLIFAAPVCQSPSKRHACDMCPYMSNSKNDYMYHRQFHQPKPGADFKCHICEYWVTHKRLLKQHLKVHEMARSPSKSVAGSVQSSPCKSDFSESSSIYDMVQLANYKQKVIASKILPSISSKPMMSPMKLACSVGNRPGYIMKNGVYKKLHKCTKCPYMNMRLRNLKLHEMMHGRRASKSQLIKCPHCDYFVGSKGLLSHHLKVHQPNYMADISDTTISDLESMEEVKFEDDVDEKSDIMEIPYESKVDTLYEIARFKKYSCEKCPYASAKRSHYERHVELHGSRQRCGCKYCDYSVPSMNLLAQHEKMHRVPNQNLMVAQSLSNLLQLPQVPADVALSSAIPPIDTKKPYTVNVTHDHLELYENSADLDLEPKKLYRCDRCPYANVRRDHLLSHLKFHMLKGDLQCPYCDYSVAKQHLLTQHIKVHFSPLPELSNWLTQNGQMERVQESKESDFSEAIYVAQLLQSDATNDDKVDKVLNETKLKSEANDVDKSKLLDIKEEPKLEREMDDKNEQISKTEEKMIVNDEPKDENNRDKSIEVEETKSLEEKINSENGNRDGESTSDGIVKMVLGEKDQPEDAATMVKSPTMPTLTVNGELMDTDDPAENMKVESYVCQYCDREFSSSDQLVRHETQHLIGNHFEGYLGQMAVPEASQCVKEQPTETVCEEPVAGCSREADKEPTAEILDSNGVTSKTDLEANLQQDCKDMEIE